MVTAARWAKIHDGVGTAQYVPGNVGMVALADVSQRAGIQENIEGLLEFGQVVRVDQHDDRTTIPGQCHALVVDLYAIDKFTEMIADRI
jgi:hypothetical protein